jgi:hypothetical protein
MTKEDILTILENNATSFMGGFQMIELDKFEGIQNEFPLTIDIAYLLDNKTTSYLGGTEGIDKSDFEELAEEILDELELMGN